MQTSRMQMEVRRRGRTIAVVTVGVLFAGAVSTACLVQPGTTAADCSPAGPALVPGIGTSVTYLPDADHPPVGDPTSAGPLQLTVYQPEDVPASSSTTTVNSSCVPSTTSGASSTSAAASSTTLAAGGQGCGPAAPVSSGSTTSVAAPTTAPPTTAPPLTGRPVLLYLHGGGFFLGNRADITKTGHEGFLTISNSNPVRDQLTRGWVVASADYGLTTDVLPAGPEGQEHHVTLRDELINAKRAIRYLQQHAGDFGIDPTRIVVTGESAGGTLATLVAVTAGQVEPPEATGPTTVRGAINLDGPTDLAGFQSCADVTTQPLPVAAAQTPNYVAVKERFSLSDGGTSGNQWVAVPYGLFLPAAVDCTNAEIAAGITASCRAKIDAAVPEVSPLAVVAGLTPDEVAQLPLILLACASSGTPNMPSGLNCATQHRPFEQLVREKLGGDDSRVWVDQVTGYHWDIGGTLNYSVFKGFLDRVVR